MFELFELGRAENAIEGEGFEELGFSFLFGVDFESEFVAIGACGEEVCILGEGSCADVGADAFSDEGFHPVSTNCEDEVCEGATFCEGMVVLFCPAFDFLDLEETGADAVGEIVKGVCDVIGPIHDLALDGFEGVAGGAGAVFRGEVLVVQSEIQVGFLGIVDEVVFGWFAGF